MMKFEDVVRELEKDEKWYLVESENMKKNEFHELAFFTNWEDAFHFAVTEPVYKNERYVISTMYTSDVSGEAIEDLLEDMDESKNELTIEDKDKLSKDCEYYEPFYTKPIEDLSSMSDEEFAEFFIDNGVSIEYQYDTYILSYNLYNMSGEVLFDTVDVQNYLNDFFVDREDIKDIEDVDYYTSIVKNEEKDVIEYILVENRYNIVEDIEKAGK